MKKIYTLIFLSVFCINAINAEFTWNLSDDGTLTISGNCDTDFKGKAPWYYKRSEIKKVVIEYGVTNIGNSVFSGYSYLTSITIPNSVTSIGERAFEFCHGLTSITIPNSVTSIGERAFYNCSGLTSVNIGNSVTSIGDWAFHGCSGLTSVNIPNSITNIGGCAFYECSALISVKIGNSVTTIGECAFYNCSSLTSITIPNSVTSIGGGAFSGCSGLTSLTIPNSVTSIGEAAFQGCSGLTSLTIPNSVTSIGDYAFRDCSGLTSVTIPNSVTSIGSSAFEGCSGLTSVTIPNSVTSIGDYAFWGCSGLTSLTIPNSVTSIGSKAFWGCSGLTSLTIPNSVTSIGKMAFGYCSGLTSVNIPNSVTSIGERALDGTKWYYNQPNGVVYAGSVLYEYKGTMPANTKIEIKEGTMGIADLAFCGYSSLTSITIPNSVTNIGRSAFKNCSGLTSVSCEATTPSSCGSDCFSGVDKSIHIYVPANSVAKYKAAKEWKEFTNIQVIIDNQSIVNAVISKIDAIGKVEYTDASKNKIDEANNAYNALTAEQKALVTNLDILTTAQQTYDNLKADANKIAADKAKADPVIAKINAIGKVEYTDACKNKIDAANTAYNALTADQKALVTNLDVLTTAKQTYENLKAAAEKLAADKAAFDKYKSEIIAIIESLVKEDDSDAVKEIIKKAINDIDALKYEDAISLDDNKAKIQSFATSTDEAVESQRAEDQKTNGIEELEFADKYNIYDLNGRKITNSMLKSGLYIRNGKKVVVK